VTWRHTTEDIIARLSRTQPHFHAWVRHLSPDPLALTFQFAVIDKWRKVHANDVDALYVRLHEEVDVWVAAHGRCLPLPTKEEFAEAVMLYLPMVLGVSWQRVRNLAPARDPVEMLARIKRSR
jgi:hypothetical protein